ncbi:MAG: PKD domain-containing protein [Bacteroidia bacterium]
MHTKKHFLHYLCFGLFFWISSFSVVAQNIVISGTPTNFCAPVVVTFTAANMPGGNANYTFVWTFSSPAGSFSGSPSLTYPNGGTFTANCTATNINTSQVTVLPPANFTINPGINAGFAITAPLGNPPQVCAGDSITINNTTTGGTAPLSYNWAYSGGVNTNNPTNPSIIYYPTTLSAGVKNIQLVVTDALGCQAFVPAQTIQLNASPDANFTINQPNPCLGLVNFSTPSSTAGLDHTWNFGDSNTSNSTNIGTSHTYSAVSGQFTVTLTITNQATGCSSTKIDTVQIGQNPPIISTSNTAVCEGGTILFTSPPPPGNTLSWTFPNASPTTAQGANATVTYSTAGTYWAYATLVNDGNGCIGKDSVQITVNANPVASFTVNDNAVCDVSQANNFIFTSTTTPSNPNYLNSWAFPGSNQGSSNLTNPSGITYSNEGAYDVSLTAMDPVTGCSNTFTATNYILIGGASAGFTAAPPGGCVGQAIQLNASPTLNNATSIVSYLWSSTGGGTFSPNTASSNPTVTYATQGNKTVTLTITDDLGCTSSSTLVVEVGTPVNGLNFNVSPAFDCVSTPFSFINTTNVMPSGAQTYWNFGESPPAITNPSLSLTTSHLFNSIGCFDVTMYVSNNGCVTQTTKLEIVCTTGILAKFGADTTNGCDVPFSLQLNDSSSAGTTLQWSVNPYIGANLSSTTSTNPTLTITTPGSYTVKLVATGTNSTCPSDSFTMVFNVGKPSATFNLSPSEDTLCVGSSVVPIIVSASNSANYRYDWGDGTSNNYSATSVLTASHTYTTVGIYTVSLIATNSIGCKDSVAFPVPVSVGGVTPTIAVNSPNSGCAPHLVNLIGGTVNPLPSGINITSWDWSANTALIPANPSGQNVSFAIDANGSFDLFLVVTDNLGCTGFTTLSNAIVVGKPVASFAPQFAAYCQGVPVTYINSSTGTGLNYNWQFPGGNPNALNGNFPNPTAVAYANSPTPYTSTLIVTDLLGCSDTATATVGVSELVATFNASNTIATCPPLKVYFDANTNGPHNVISYDWNFGQFVTTDTTHWTYFIPGDYDVTLIVTSDAGCKDTVTQTNLVQIDGPSATYNFTPKVGCPGTEVTFQLLGSTDADRYFWVYGDGGLSDSIAISSGVTTNTHTYVSPGTYQPTILVKNLANCAVVMPFVDSVQIYQPPIVDFVANPTIICQSGSTTLTSLSQPGDAPLLDYVWQMPNGTPTTATGSSASVSYANIGSYDITLIVTDTHGCKDTLTKDDYIFVVDNIKPNPSPIESASTLSDTEVRVTYRKFPNPNNDFAQYRLYRDGVQIYTTSNISDTVYTDTGLDTRNLTYNYEIEVVSACGTASDKSPLHTTMVLSSVAQNGCVQLNWTPYVGWGTVQNYRIYRITDYNTIQNLVVTLDGNTIAYLDTAIDCTSAINYRVEAVSSANISAWSDTTQGAGIVTGSIPIALDMKLATVVNNQFVKVSWENIPYIRRLKEIVIERDAGSGFQGIQAYPVGSFPNPLEYEDNSQINVQQQAYTYRVVGIDSCEQRTIQGRVATSIHLNAQNVGGSILLSWTPYSQWATGIDYYQVELFNQNTQQYVVLGTVLPPFTAFVDDTVLFAQAQNCYRVLAYEKEGNELVSESNQDCASPDGTVFSPTAFSPNGDGINDVFFMTTTFVKDFSMVIFDRWGKKIFESNNPSQGWDGKINGKDAPEGVYTYRVKMLGHAEGSVNRERYGTITLVR